MSIKYAHTNIVAKDWRRLADFYVNVFDCKYLDPERDLSGKWIENVTKIDKVRIRGVHLALPGYREGGPTLEIFEYTPESLRIQQPPQINDQGFTHIAFVVDNVAEVLAKVIKNGGKKYGELVKKEYDSLGILTVVYAVDPECNIIEIQNWEK
ncbi:VOC family protein [Gracilibacillus salitolerans]|uniref:VOC family protein n=1 Tax=Gracilibacillus salitolerans TaxID=2663022 RepID=A0A5Q2TRN6_9BACI|nr:VOC family protein [Gracilibacillus salitolerans]QGH36891.1 VOC family protein [Gracilibacillus salitolerans]